MKFADILEQLSNACGVAGREEEVRTLMKELLTPNVDEIREDKLGNIIGVKKGKKDAPTLMFAAHMDEIGLMVNGNGGWGRIIFEFTDANGQTWTSIGAAQSGDPPHWMNDWMSKEDIERMGDLQIGDWNTNDAWQRSRINFEGWRYLRFPMPGNYPGEGYHWPYSSQWRHTGDGIVHYPIKFTRLIVETPQKILRMKEFKPVARPEIYLKDLMVTYRPPEEAFAAE